MPVNILNLDHVQNKVGQEEINKSGLYRQLVSYSGQLTRLAYKLHVSLENLNQTKLKRYLDAFSAAYPLIYLYQLKSLFV